MADGCEGWAGKGFLTPIPLLTALVRRGAMALDELDYSGGVNRRARFTTHIDRVRFIRR